MHVNDPHAGQDEHDADDFDGSDCFFQNQRGQRNRGDRREIASNRRARGTNTLHTEQPGLLGLGGRKEHQVTERNPIALRHG